jgi:transcription antitermination factor NusG
MAMRWYIIHCYARCELSVADRIHTDAVEQGLAYLLDNVVTLTGEGQRNNPGYVLIHCELTDELD